ncbi:hypothetical protein SESBI_37741 [Sesbania bispinosa]|nr:hypothetical protein SESBI_37741 [Sesbania bispinosa]
MGTRTNFYKNPSISYNKHFSLSSVLENLRAYNIATGNAPPDDQPHPVPTASVKRRRDHRPPQSREDDHDDDPSSMSHSDYIQKRRQNHFSCSLPFLNIVLLKEVASSQNHDRLELTEDVLGNPNSALPLVDYASDEGTSAECEETHTLPNSGPSLSASDEDTSAECEETHTPPNSGLFPSAGHKKEFNGVKSRNEQRFPVSGEPVCLICGRYGEYICNEITEGCNRSSSIPKDLLGLYRRCHQIGKDLLAGNCNVCRSSSNLATCLDCSIVLCDGAGHLDEHIRTHASHQKYYSHKLKRLVKCCKSTCKVTDIKDLLVCHYCFDKAFEKFYDMYTATW